MNVNQKVTERILNRIKECQETGKDFHWVKPFSIGAPQVAQSYITEYAYRGINRLLLEPNEYISFNAVQDVSKQLGVDYHIRKNSHGFPVVFYSEQEIKDKDGNYIYDSEGNKQKRGFLRYYTVFSREDVINQDGDNLPSKLNIKKFNYDDIVEDQKRKLQQFEELAKNYCESRGIEVQRTVDGTACYYSPLENVIRLPKTECFSSIFEYVSSFSHEMVHSTAKELNRKTSSKEGTALERYSREELVAEIGAAMIVSELGIIDDRAPDEKDNIEAYLVGWAKYLKGKETTSEIVSAASKSEKAVDLILETYRELNKDKTTDRAEEER